MPVLPALQPTKVIHRVHDGHEFLEPGHGFLFVAFGHELLTEAGDHAHHLGERTHLHDVLELFVHVTQ